MKTLAQAGVRRQYEEARQLVLGGRGRLPLMDKDYPEDLLAREPAPPHAGEGPFALWHVSENPSLDWFRPRAPPRIRLRGRVSGRSIPATPRCSGSRVTARADASGRC